MGIGDNLMFFRSLMNYKWKEEDLVWVIKPEFRDIIQFYFPNSKIIIFEFSNFKMAHLFSIRKIISELRNEKIKKAIILDYKTKPVLFFLCMLFCVGIKNIKYTPSEALRLLNKNLPDIKQYEKKHEVERYRDLLKYFFAATSNNEVNLFSVVQRGGKLTDVNDQIIIIAPGSARMAKRWSINKFIELAKRLIALGYEIVFVGGKNDNYLVQTINHNLRDDRIKNFIGELSFIETGEWVKRSKLVVSNDSALMHYADLIGKSVVAIFGITDPQRCGPYTQIHNCVVNNSYYPKYSYGPFPDNVSDKFINEITVDAIFYKCLKILSNGKN